MHSKKGANLACIARKGLALVAQEERGTSWLHRKNGAHLGCIRRTGLNVVNNLELVPLVLLSAVERSVDLEALDVVDRVEGADGLRDTVSKQGGV